MRQDRVVHLFLAATLLLAAGGIRAETASVLLEKGIYTEETLGDPSSAIGIYEQVVASGEADRPYAAQAQFRLAKCHLKLKQNDQAREALKLLVKNYADQEQLVAQAKPLLEELLEFDPAILMPPDTLLYVEVGSPGEQLETILKMLEGTPFANPLEAMAPSGTSTQPAGPPGEKSPAQIIGALLNPSMLKEFKKLRSLAVGITGLKGEQPPMVIILRPGDSDAVRGIVTAAVLAAGQPTSPMEGMQTVQLSPEVGCAFDENVFLFAAPLSRLQWCVRQYKRGSQTGLGDPSGTPEPSLLTQNASFAQLAPAVTRKADALTIWANPSAAFNAAKTVLPERNINDLMLANAFLDLEGMDGIVARLRFNENSIALEAAVTYRQGHTALGYDLIRTCPLDRGGFAAVPPQAVGLAALALSDRAAFTETAVAGVQQQAVQRLIGLDLGRELFSNIEQVTLFLMPPSEAALAHPTAKLSSIVPSLGLAITSRRPAQTLAVLDWLLSFGGRIPMYGAPAPAVSEQGLRRYVAGDIDKMPVYLHMAQKDSTTVLAFLPEVVQGSLEAMGTGHNAATDGPLAKALGRVGERNKVILLSTGGALRWYDAVFVQPLLKQSAARAPASQPATDTQAIADQLATALDDTLVRLETSEQPNTFMIRAEVSGIPPLAKVFPLVTQYMQERQSKAQAAQAPRRATPSRKKMLEPTSSKFAKAVARRDQAVLKELIVPGSPAEAKVAAILEKTDLPEFHIRTARRAGNVGITLSLPEGTDKPPVALLIRLQLIDSQKVDVWRVVDVDILPLAEAAERLEKFTVSAPPQEAPPPERNKLLWRGGSEFLSALQKNDEGAIRELTVPNSPAEAKIKDLLATPGLLMFRSQEMQRKGDFGWVLVYYSAEREDPSAGAMLIHLHQYESAPRWRVTDVDSLPILRAQQRLSELVRQSTRSTMPATAPSTR